MLAPVTLWLSFGILLSPASQRGSWLSLVYMAAFPSVVCYLIFSYALLAHSRFARFRVLLPAAAASPELVAVPVLGEPITCGARHGRSAGAGRRVHHGARLMAGFFDLLRDNRNYRHMWIGQVVSEVGDHFNNIAVFSLALANTGSGLVVTRRHALARHSGGAGRAARRRAARPLGPQARHDRQRPDSRRGGAGLHRHAVVPVETWLLYVLSGLLMFASPFFTSGRASILPTIASREELHTANTLTQTTQWSTLVHRRVPGRDQRDALRLPVGLRPQRAFVSVLGLVHLAAAGSRRELPRRAHRRSPKPRWCVPGTNTWKACATCAPRPLIFGIAMINVGWATGGGAAQILFSLFGEIVFKRGPAGIGVIWGCAGIGLLAGGAIGHWLGQRLSFDGYKRTIIICYILHGGAYVLFSQMQASWAALALHRAVARGGGGELAC